MRINVGKSKFMRISKMDGETLNVSVNGTKLV